jgi:hypothetical protein
MSKLSPDFSSVTRAGLDLVQSVFQVHAVDAAGAEIDKRAGISVTRAITPN